MRPSLCRTWWILQDMDDPDYTDYLEDPKNANTTGMVIGNPPVAGGRAPRAALMHIGALARHRFILPSYERFLLRQSLQNMDVQSCPKDMMVEMIKQCQRLDIEMRTSWIHYTNSEAKGVRDPSKHDEAFLRRFFSGLQDGRNVFTTFSCLDEQGRGYRSFLRLCMCTFAGYVRCVCVFGWMLHTNRGARSSTRVGDAERGGAGKRMLREWRLGRAERTQDTVWWGWDIFATHELEEAGSGESRSTDG